MKQNETLILILFKLLKKSQPKKGMSKAAVKAWNDTYEWIITQHETK